MRFASQTLHLTLVAFALLMAAATSPPEAVASADCAANPVALTFSNGPVIEGSGTVASTNCHAIDGAQAGDKLVMAAFPEVSNYSYLSATVSDSTGATICSTTGNQLTHCALTGVEPWKLKVSVSAWGSPFPYRVLLKQVNQPAGCAPIGDTATWSFVSAVSTGSFSGNDPADCYTFTKSGGPNESRFMFRASPDLGSSSPLYTIYHDDGTVACNGSAGTSDIDCTLTSDGTYHAVLQNRSFTTVGTYRFSGRKLSPISSGCEDVSVSFASEPTIGSLGSNDTDCFEVSGINAGDRLNVSFPETSLGWRSLRGMLVDSVGARSCTILDDHNESDCVVTGVGPWHFLLSEFNGSQADYALKIARLNSPLGCTAMDDPTKFAFDGGPIEGNIAETGEIDCFSFLNSSGVVPRNHLFTAGNPGALINAQVTITDGGGNVICNQTTATGALQTCALPGWGQYFAVVRDANRSASGPYDLALKPLDQAGACVGHGPTTVNAAPKAGNVDLGRMDCLNLDDLAPFENVQVAFRTTSSTGAWMLVDAAGAVACWGRTTAFCKLGPGTNWRLVTVDTATAPFMYKTTVRGFTDTPECTEIDDNEAFDFGGPVTVGQISQEARAECFTFTLPEDSEDEIYRVRASATAGSLAPLVTIVEPDGEVRCVGKTTACTLSSSGRHVVVVTDNQHTHTGSFGLTLRRAAGSAGCTMLAGIGFDDPVSTGSIDTSTSEACYSVPDVSTNDRAVIRLNGISGAGRTPRWELVDGDGSTICSSNYATSPCSFSGAPGWKLIVSDSEKAVFDFRAAVLRINNPDGCSTPVEQFDAPGRLVDATDTIAASCTLITRGISEPPKRYWLRATRVSGTGSPAWTLYNPNGSTFCQQQASGYDAGCLLNSPGSFTAVFVGSNNGMPATYVDAVRIPSSATGCVEADLKPTGIDPIGALIGTVGEVDCYTFDAESGDQLRLTKGGVIDDLSIVAPDGSVVCPYWSSCTIPATGRYLIVALVAGPPTTGGYQFKAECLNIPCGKIETSVVEATPNRLGAGDFVTTSLRGRNLDMLQSVELRREGVTVTGIVRERSNDNRVADVRFNLSSAAIGNWDIRAQFTDGSISEIPDGLTVEPVETPEVSVELVGRDVFRAGQPASFTAVLTNDGNVDALAVPMIIRGFPEGSTVEPQFDFRAPTGAAGGAGETTVPFNQDVEGYVEEGRLNLPMMAPQIPAGQSMQVEFNVTTPSAGSYQITAETANCLTGESALPTGLDTGQIDCYGAIAGATMDLLGMVPGASCVATVGDIAASAITDSMGGESMWSWGNTWNWLLGTAGCAVDLIPAAAVAKSAALALKATAGLHSVSGELDDFQKCLAWASSGSLERRGVNSFDPNEIVGPAGNGIARYIPGTDPLPYRILFENLATASAPAQKVTIENQLDPAKFKLSSLAFNEFKLGEKSFKLDRPSADVDQNIDLRPTRNLLVHIEADVDSNGKLKVVMQALDPDTLLPPADPMAGFLPPNIVKPEGEGHVSYMVDAKNLPAGTSIPNSASIVFDNNEAIATPIWMNTIDKLPPAPSINVVAGANSKSAVVNWSGTDDASGIERYEISVARNDGSFEAWRIAGVDGSQTFDAQTTGSYRFRVVAHDGAGNFGQSASATIGLSTEITTTPAPTCPGSAGCPPPPVPTDDPTIALGSSAAIKVLKSGAFATTHSVGCVGNGPNCTVAITIVSGSKSVGKIEAVLRAGQTQRLKAKLTKQGLTLLKKRTKLKVKLSVRIDRGLVTVSKTIDLMLRAPRVPRKT